MNMDAIVTSPALRPSTLTMLKNLRWPIGVGALGVVFLVSVYLGILTVAQSFDHALQQLSQDWIWVGLVASGFGTQIGLYTYLRAIVRASNATGATAMTGAGTGTSTLGMVACCAHHVTDVAPLLGLAGLGGAAAFLAEYKVPFIVFGLAVNAVGIAITLRTICKQRRMHNAQFTGH